LVKKNKKVIYYQICPYCNKIAFYYKEKPYPGMKIRYSNTYNRGDDKNIIRCRECRKIIYSKYLNHKYLGIIDGSNIK